MLLLTSANCSGCLVFHAYPIYAPSDSSITCSPCLASPPRHQTLSRKACEVQTLNESNSPVHPLISKSNQYNLQLCIYYEMAPGEDSNPDGNTIAHMDVGRIVMQLFKEIGRQSPSRPTQNHPSFLQPRYTEPMPCQSFPSFPSINLASALSSSYTSSQYNDASERTPKLRATGSATGSLLAWACFISVQRPPVLEQHQRSHDI